MGQQRNGGNWPSDCSQRRFIGNIAILPHAALISWWRHQMETFFALLDLCAGNFTVTGEFSSQRPVTRSFDVSVDRRQNKRLSKQSWGWWFETPPRPLWRHRNEFRLKQRTHQGPALLALCMGNPPVSGGFPHKGPVVQNSFPGHDVAMSMAERIAVYRRYRRY